MAIEPAALHEALSPTFFGLPEIDIIAFALILLAIRMEQDPPSSRLLEPNKVLQQRAFTATTTAHDDKNVL